MKTESLQGSMFTIRMRCPASALLVAFVVLPLMAQGRSAAELEKAGWEAIRANRLQEAADSFRAAIRLEPRSVRLVLGAGLAAHLLGRSEEARQHLVAALEADATLTEASMLLGQILYGQGDLAGAIHVYELALVHAPKTPLLLERLETWRREEELHGRFSQRYGDHFTVLFEGPREEAIAKHAIELLERSYWRIGTALGAYPNGIVTVVLYTNEQFRDVTQSPAWAAGAFDGRIRVPMRGALNDPTSLERVLAHEFTHALIHSLAPRGVPQWLNEGLAQVFEPGGHRGVATLQPQAPDIDRPAPGMPLSRLEKSFEGLDGNEARMAYLQSAEAARVLVEQAGTIGVLNLLSFIGEGMPFAQAFERATFVSYADFQKNWK
jgi:tetratricopeptide (TPR) repeat protein